MARENQDTSLSHQAEGSIVLSQKREFENLRETNRLEIEKQGLRHTEEKLSLESRHRQYEQEMAHRHRQELIQEERHDKYQERCYNLRMEVIKSLSSPQVCLLAAIAFVATVILFIIVATMVQQLLTHFVHEMSHFFGVFVQETSALVNNFLWLLTSIITLAILSLFFTITLGTWLKFEKKKW